MLVAYITSHGFGHAARACEALRRLPPEIPLMLRTRVPPWFLESRLHGRTFDFAPAEFDCGTLGPDSRRIDVQRTLEALEPILEANDARLPDEVTWLERSGALLVVSDVPALPLAAARRAGIPSILVANFTWSAIYGHLLDYDRPSAALAVRLAVAIERLDAQYAEGDLLLVPGFDIPMSACHRRLDVPLMATAGRPRRAELARALGFDASRPLVLVYLGREGLADIRWEHRARLADWQLVSFQVPDEAAGLIRPLPEALISHSDAVASVNAVVGKAGYGICTECIASGTPLLYPPRPQFAESSAIDRVMRQWGGAIALDEKSFLNLEWKSSLDALLNKRLVPQSIDCSGGTVCAAHYTSAWRGLPFGAAN